MSLFGTEVLHYFLLGPGPVSPYRPDAARHDLQTRHRQHRRPEDRGESRRQEEAGEDGHPQVSPHYGNPPVVPYYGHPPTTEFSIISIISGASSRLEQRTSSPRCSPSPRRSCCSSWTRRITVDRLPPMTSTKDRYVVIIYCFTSPFSYGFILRCSLMTS